MSTTNKIGFGFTMIAVLALSLTLTGCGGGGGGTTPAPAYTAPTTYTVTYNGNGSADGSVPTDATNYEQGQIVTVPGNTGNLIRIGNAFAGWNMQADGNGTTYAQGQTFAMGSVNIILYARWTANPTYTVTYSGNGNTSGSAPADSSHYEAGQTVTVLANAGNLAKTGYTFAGWNTVADGTGTIYTQGQTFAMGAVNIILYARWTANHTYTVTYNGNGSTGGSVPTDATNYEQDQTVTVPGNTGNLVKTGYSFTGWNTRADGTGTNYGASFLMGASNITLYAKWTANPTHTIIYDGNGATGSVPVDSANYEQGAAVTVLGKGTLARTGYSFDGWNTLSDGTGTTYTQGQTLTMGSANVALYAKWTANPTYTVTYNGNGVFRCVTYIGGNTICEFISPTGSVPIDTSSYGEGTPVTVLGNTGKLVEAGYSFAGWNTDAWGTGTTYTGGQTFPMGSVNATLYAMWTATMFTDNLNGTITDNRTGLIWIQVPENQARNWTESHTYCNNLNFGDSGNWHAPSLAELQGLIQGWTGESPAAWLNSKGFSIVHYPYWVVEGFRDNETGLEYGWVISLLDGSEYLDNRYTSHWVLPVRTGP